MNATEIIKSIHLGEKSLVGRDLYGSTNRRTQGMDAKKQRVEALKPEARKKLRNQFNQPKYTFLVDPRANKHQIGHAVHELYKVKVVAVNTINSRTKPGRKLTRFPRAPRDYKKAVVTLMEGEKIETI